MIGGSAAATPLLDEPFGDHLTNECASTWDGQCEEDWTPTGADDSLKMVQSGGNWGVLVNGGVTFPNGAGRSVALASSVPAVRLVVKAKGTDGSGQLGARLVFRDSSGNSVKVESHVSDIEKDQEGMWNLLVKKPPSAETVDAQFAFAGSGGKAVIDSVSMIEDTIEIPNIFDKWDCYDQAAGSELREATDCGTSGNWIGFCNTVFVNGVCEELCAGVCWPEPL